MTIATDLIPELNFMYGSTSIPDDTWVMLIRDAMRAIRMVQPEAFAEKVDITLAPSVTRQTLPPNYSKILRLDRNMGAGGSTPGLPLEGPVPMVDLDRLSRTWHTDANANGYIEFYVYDQDTEPGAWWCYPQAPATAWHVEGRLLAEPNTGSFAIPNASAAFPLKARHITPTLDWCLWRAWGRDDEESPTYARGLRHMSSFYQAYGIDIGSKQRKDPRYLEYTRAAPVGTPVGGSAG